MASSFLLARGVGPPSSISSTTSQWLFRRSLVVGRLLSSNSIGRRRIVCQLGMERGAEIPILRRGRRLFSTTERGEKRGKGLWDIDSRSPLEKLANSMEGRCGLGLNFQNTSKKTALEPLLIEPFTTATTEAGDGASINTGNEASSRIGDRTEAGVAEARELNFTGTTTTTAPPPSPPFYPLPPPPPPSTTPTATTSTAGEGASGSNGKQKGGWFSEIDDPTVGYWLLGSAGLVFGIVVLGGLTRLTESGLSITEWKPVTGSIPPLNKADWEEVFEKYKDSPEYRVLNPNITLDEFKFIYYMEWTHRLWGRVIGLTFVIPAAFFIARGRVTPRTAAKLVGISGLIGFQGFIGWWMVKSGLKDDLFTTPGNSVPRVSQYRLTAHLCAAFTVYLAMLYNGLSILRNNKFINNPVLAQTEFKILSDPRLLPLRRTVLGLALLTFTTAMSGGLVAGLDAGLIYNDFPKMGTGYKPPNSELFNPFYARDKENHKDLWWRNMLENPSTVQFQHRCLAMTTFSSIVGFWMWARFGRVNGTKVWGLLNRKMRMGVNGALHLVMLQAALGISTLIYMVPTPLAAAHQAGSLALLTGIMVLGVRVSPTPKRVVGIVAGKMNELMGMGPGAVVRFMGLRGLGIGTMENVILGDAAKAAKEGLQQEGPRIQRIMTGQKSLVTGNPAVVSFKPVGGEEPLESEKPQLIRWRSEKASRLETGPLSETTMLPKRGELSLRGKALKGGRLVESAEPTENGEVVEGKVKLRWKLKPASAETVKPPRSASSKRAEATSKSPQNDTKSDKGR